MAYAENEGVRVHYQVEGNGPPIVLQHGILWSIEGWYREGYVDALKPDYQLVLIDARGHGGSDKPHDNASYTLAQHVGDITSVLDALNISRAHFWGYSMGGWFGFGMAKYAPDRLKSLMLGGAHPYQLSRSAAGLPLDEGVEAFIGAFLGRLGVDLAEFSPEEKAEMLNNDCHAMAACLNDRPSLEDVLPTIQVPSLFYAGSDDGSSSLVSTSVETVPHGRFVSIPGVNHPRAFYRSDLVLPHIKEFLRSVATS